MNVFENLSWPRSQLPEALTALGAHSGLSNSMALTAPPEDAEDVARWLELNAAPLGLELEPVSVPYGQLEDFIATGGPALVGLPCDQALFLLLLRGGRRRVMVLGPGGKRVVVRSSALRAVLSAGFENPLKAEVDALLDEAGVAAARVARARKQLLAVRLGEAQLEGVWLLRLPPGANPWRQVRQSGLIARGFALVAAHTAAYILFILAWWLIGRGALQGRTEGAWLLAWALALVSLVPFQLLTSWLQGSLAVRAGALLKMRLLYGTLRHEPEELRHQGVGQLLGRVLESGTVETLAMSGGLAGLIALAELGLASVVLAAGASGWLVVGLLLAWTGLTAWLGANVLARRQRWAHSRLELTHALVEGMTGHRTRLAQEARATWHENEDRLLAPYLAQSTDLDQSLALFTSLVPRGWLIVGLVGLAPAFIVGANPGALAVGLGGVLLAHLAFSRMAAGLLPLAEAVTAWQQIAPLFWAAGRSKALGSSAVPTRNKGPRSGVPLIEARNLGFRYRAGGAPILEGCSLKIYESERLLLEGPSGGGKSTLATLLTGLHQPEVGCLLLGGLDHASLGEDAWRERVATAPQFYENHVLRGSFLFNLLLGRSWPPRRSDVEEALALCHDLGLGDLLKRMPAGPEQMVGETGWRLSHGEKSRLYLARALLQRADLVILDESFAALDPENLARALRCAVECAPTLLVVAHP